MTSFKVGDCVTWRSQSAGRTKEKAGVVVAVVPGGRHSGRRADEFVAQRVRARTHKSAFGGGLARDNESYIVEVPASTPSGKPILYWPLAKNLRAAEISGKEMGCV